MNEKEIRDVVSRVLSNIENTRCVCGENAQPAADNEILLEASGRHVHLTKQAVEALFGEGAVLTPKKYLSQTGEFLSEQRVKVVTSRGEFCGVAVLGPERSAVQTELSATDCRALGIKAPVNLSGDLSGAADVFLVSDSACYNAAGSAIIAKRHVHLSDKDAERYGVKDGEKVKIRVSGERPIVFEDVVVRVKDSFTPAVHIDFDEANACLYSPKVKAYLIKEGE